MDIVTAGRACARRWYLFIPILVIGILASLHIANATKPTYEATGEFIVLNSAVRPVTSGPATKPTPTPRVTVTKTVNAGGKGKASTSPTPKTSASPTPTVKPTPVPTTTVVNPYATSSDLLRAALLADLNGDAFREQISKAGHKGAFTVALAKKQPIYDLSATARHRPQAVALVNAVLDQANAEVHLVQTEAGAPANTLLGVQVLTRATAASDITSGKSKRLVAGIVVTAAAAIALSLALDTAVSALRRRRSTADGRVAGEQAAGADVPADPAPPVDGAYPAPSRGAAQRPSPGPVAGSGDELTSDPAPTTPRGRLSGRGRD